MEWSSGYRAARLTINLIETCQVIVCALDTIAMTVSTYIYDGLIIVSEKDPKALLVSHISNQSIINILGLRSIKSGEV